MQRKTCNEEGCNYPVWARGKCKFHDAKSNPPKPIRKVRDPVKRNKKIENSNNYYRKMIGLNIIKNKGCCRCDECGDEIKRPFSKNFGRLVCHILSDKAHPLIYFDELNGFILGRGALFNECGCGAQFDDSAKASEMKIFPTREQRKTELKSKYYANQD